MAEKQRSIFIRFNMDDEADCDLCANAKGYEFLAGQMMGKKVE